MPRPQGRTRSRARSITEHDEQHSRAPQEHQIVERGAPHRLLGALGPAGAQVLVRPAWRPRSPCPTTAAARTARRAWRCRSRRPPCCRKRATMRIRATQLVVPMNRLEDRRARQAHDGRHDAGVDAQVLAADGEVAAPGAQRGELVEDTDAAADRGRARRRHAKKYSEELADSGLRLLQEPAACKSVYHIFPLFTAQRNELREHLEANGISSGIHYPIPVHMQSGFSNLGFSEGDLPQTESVCREVLSLPMYPELADDTVRQIADSVRQFCRQPMAVHP